MTTCNYCHADGACVFDHTIPLNLEVTGLPIRWTDEEGATHVDLVTW